MSKSYKMGCEAGRAAGSWVLDGNSSSAEARWILEGYEDGDPAVMDMQPSPLSGEWAGESIREIFGRWPSPREMDLYELGYSEGFWGEVQRSARALLD